MLDSWKLSEHSLRKDWKALPAHIFLVCLLHTQHFGYGRKYCYYTEEITRLRRINFPLASVSIYFTEDIVKAYCALHKFMSEGNSYIFLPYLYAEVLFDIYYLSCSERHAK
jgi:hypothetical protein